MRWSRRHLRGPGVDRLRAHGGEAGRQNSPGALAQPSRPWRGWKAAGCRRPLLHCAFAVARERMREVTAARRGTRLTVGLVRADG